MTEIQLSNNDECINVILRIRPKNQNETSLSSIKISDNKKINIGIKSFNYDYI